MTFFYFSIGIISIYWVVGIFLTGQFQISLSEGQTTRQFKHCNSIKDKFGKGLIENINWWYYPKCKPDRPDLFANLQVGQTDKFCVNVSTGIPFYRTAKSITKSLNCDIAVFKLRITTLYHVSELSDKIKVKLQELLLGSVGHQMVKIVTQQNQSSNMIIELEIYSIGHRSTNDISTLLKSRLNEGQIGSVEFDSEKSQIDLLTSNLADPPEMLYIPNKPEMPIISEDYSIGEQRNSVIEDKYTNVESIKPDSGSVWAITLLIIAGCIVAVLLILYCIYRLRKKDEGSYVLNKTLVPNKNDKRKKSMPLVSNAKEYFA